MANSHSVRLSNTKEHELTTSQNVCLPSDAQCCSITTQFPERKPTKVDRKGKILRKSPASTRLNAREFSVTHSLSSNLSITEQMSAPRRSVAFLVASLGNPPPYHSTRHSVGHLILKALQNNMSLPSFTMKSKPFGGGHISVGAEVGKPEFTLWQSPSLMNTSGVALVKAYKQFASVQQSSPTDPITGLIVLHDEMETEPGKLKIRRGGNTSAKGHNGIKSVQASLQGGGLLDKLGDRFIKIGVGIGRPSGGSRESRDVSAYVLGQLTPREKDGLENAAREVEGVFYQEMGRIMQQE